MSHGIRVMTLGLSTHETAHKISMKESMYETNLTLNVDHLRGCKRKKRVAKSTPYVLR